MPAGVGIIVRVGSLVAPNNYAHFWRSSPAQIDVDTLVSGETLGAAYSAIGTLALALTGTIQRVRITVRNDQGATGYAQIWKSTTNGPYAYQWKDDVTQTDWDTTLTGKTLSAAYNEVGTLALAMGGVILWAAIQPDSA